MNRKLSSGCRLVTSTPCSKFDERFGSVSATGPPPTDRKLTVSGDRAYLHKIREIEARGERRECGERRNEAIRGEECEEERTPRRPKTGPWTRTVCGLSLPDDTLRINIIQL